MTNLKLFKKTFRSQMIRCWAHTFIHNSLGRSISICLQVVGCGGGDEEVTGALPLLNHARLRADNRQWIVNLEKVVQ